ncbi:MAG TPA: ribulose-phosphate 3-epimerase [Bacteroidota bacterium]|nr:ribulose-phosphate 3-epimerase [Bacteroidota bacterium]
MSHTTIIAPSLLSANFANLEQDIRACEHAGVTMLHVDVMDGHFVPNITIGPPVVRSIRRITQLPLDTHLMIEEPSRYLDAFAEAGSTTLIVHYEADRHLHRTVTRIRELGLKAGVCLNPATPIEVLTEILPYCDVILIMSVNPGFGGQSFIPTSFEKIRNLRAMIESMQLSTQIEVDGGIAAENAGLLAAAGANILVTGSAVFGRGPIESSLRELRNAVQ